MYNNREEYICDNISEKITLAHLSCSRRLYNFNNPSTDVYTKVTDFVVTEIKNFTKALDTNVVDGEFYFDFPTKTLYIGSSNPIEDVKILATFRLFFSNAPIITTWDLTNSGYEVDYEARLKTSPNFKSDVGVDQKGISVANTGTMSLNNSDGFFDEIYDQYIFENKVLEVYSFHRDLQPSESKIIFRGNVYDKSFSSNDVKFQAKDAYTRLESAIELPRYTLDDNINSKFVDTFKRRVYGEVNGMKVRGIDQIGSGFQLDGTISTDLFADISVTGLATQFITEGILLVNDLVDVGGQEFRIKTIDSETELTMVSVDGSSIDADRDSLSKVTFDTKSGSISTNLSDPKQIDGVGTVFTSELDSGDIISVSGIYLEVDYIADNNTLFTTSNIPKTLTSLPYSTKVTQDVEGEVSFLPPNRILNGTGTSFLTQVSPEDFINIAGSRLEVQKVIDDETILIDDENPLLLNLTDEIAMNEPESGVSFLNRTFQVSSHYLKEQTYTLVSQDQFNRITLDDVTNIQEGDFLELNGSNPESIQVRRISGNQLILVQNLSFSHTAGDTVTRSPIRNVYIDNSQIDFANIVSRVNNSDFSSFTISETTEFDLAVNKTLSSSSFLFVAGSREVSILGSKASNVENILKSRDYVKAYGDGDSLFEQVLSVDEEVITLRSPYQGISGVKNLIYRNVSMIDDDTSISVDVVGKPINNDPGQDLTKTASDIVRDLLIETDLQDYLNTSSFDQAKIDSPYVLGVVIPEDIDSKSAPSVKNIIDKINQTVYGSMVIDNDLNIKYNILDNSVPDSQDLAVIRFDDVIRWSVKNKSNNLYIETVGNYNKREDTGLSSQHTHQNETSIDFETSNKTQEVEMLSTREQESIELIERLAYISALSRTEISITSDLRLSTLSMGDKVILDLPRLFKRLGDQSSRLRVLTVTGVDISGEKTKLKLSDLGNIYNKTSVISSDSSDEFSIANEQGKIYSAYITEENGSINNIDETQNTNLIF